MTQNILVGQSVQDSLSNDEILADSTMLEALPKSTVNAVAASKTVPKNKKIYTFDLNEGIFPAAWRKVSRAVEEAEAANVDYIVMQLNTYGGAVDMADSIRTKLLKAKPTTVVLINNNAASAGALISLACDSIFMVGGAQIGAATVVDGTGAQAPDKYQSYMRATMRSTAEEQGRDPRIAEAMVDDRIAIPGIIDSAKTLTFTTSEALQHGFCDGTFNDLNEVVKHLSSNAQVSEFKPTFGDHIMNFLLNPMVSSILIMVIFIGIYSEVQTPGVGFPLMAAVTAATLYFAPNYIDGLAEHWELALFFIGLLLVAAEIFVLPGFGVAGASGILAILVSLSLTVVHNDFFDFSATAPGDVEGAFARVLFSIFGSIVIAILLGGRFVKSEMFKRLILEETQKTDKGYSIKSSQYAHLVGKQGIALTDLKISGRIEIDNERYEVITTGEFVEAGTTVRVKAYQGAYLVVTPV